MYQDIVPWHSNGQPMKSYWSISLSLSEKQILIHTLC